MGAVILLEGGYVNATAPAGLQGAEIVFPFVSVGATENLLMAATLAHGRTTLINAAREPEITDLGQCLLAMGAQIQGVGTGKLVIDGVPSLHGAQHAIVPDRIETGTYACAAAIAGGAIKLLGARIEHMASVASVMAEAGVEITQAPDGLMVHRLNGLHGTDVQTEPYPGFPTDMQAQFMSLMCVAEGAAMLTETIFENRFMHAPELNRMGARINVHGSSAIVRGVKRLAGLAASGETIVNRVYHLDRGYEAIERQLGGCGADIERLED
jgi:UDP-N-acetylglucosamine 1-carboxyvinyltransferase